MAHALPLRHLYALVATLLTPGAAGQDVAYERDVLPLLADRCFACHGPDEQARKAELRLDRPDGPLGAYRTREGRPAIAPGAPDGSALWHRVTAADRAERMPPADSHEEPLSAEEQGVLRRWIEQGAAYEDHWAFVAPARPDPPAVEDPGWCRDPIDRFVLRRLEHEGLAPSPEADARALVRRVTLDLTGLPPTRDQLHEFLADTEPGAYGRLVDRLLASPRYGEHLARYWLDLVRFADTNGIHHDHYRELTPYRDWVIRAFNANLPFDAFATWQLAGDLYPEPTDDQLVASGFHRLHMIIDAGTALPEESLARNVIDRTNAFGTVFLGLTVECGVCHDHKYDPFTQRDYYSLSAFFNNLDAQPETGWDALDKRRGLQPPYVEFPSEAQAAALAELDAELGAAQARVDERRAAAGEVGDEAARQALDEALKPLLAELGELRARRQDLVATVPAAMVMRVRAEPRPTYVLIRGNYERPGPPVERATPAFLPPLQPASADPTRMDLARWLLAPDHPLTARVVVNRLWQQLLGVGLVKTSEDLGTQGEWPSHPELLDHLATSFVDSGWDVKALVRRIVSSATYRQSSLATREVFARDPENRLLARGSRFRLDAEVIRDQVLATSGLLNTAMYGRSVKPPQPDGIWEAVTLPSSYPRSYEPDTGPATRRRSVYTFWKRALPPPQMSILNAPTREYCTARRERTNTPLQALLLLNEREYLEAARHLAATTLADGELRSAEERLDAIYETITARLPDATERAALLDLVGDLVQRYTVDPALAAPLADGASCGCGGPACGAGCHPAQTAAWTVLVSTIHNLDLVKTRE